MNRPARAPCAERKSRRLAAVQMIFADSIAGNLAKIEHAATQAAADGADAVLFPECATTSYAFDFEALKPAPLRQALRSVATIAARLQIHLLVGSPIFSGRRLYNALVVFDRRGRLIHTYAKCQLVEADRQWFPNVNLGHRRRMSNRQSQMRMICSSGSPRKSSSTAGKMAVIGPMILSPAQH